MPAQVHVQATAIEQPEAGAKQVARALLDRFPRQRPVTLAVLAHGPHPGLTPTPWVLDGLLAALVEAEQTPVNFITLGDTSTAETLLRKASPGAGVSSGELVERPSRDRQLSLRMPPREQPLAVLREIVGSSLIVCAPLACALSEPKTKTKRRQVRGPLASTLAAFAEACGVERASKAGRRPSLLASAPSRRKAEPDARLRIAHELLGSAFASAAVVLDASWLALVGDESRTPARARSLIPARKTAASVPALESLAELESPARVLGLGDIGRTDLATLLDFDAWLGHTIGLDLTAPREAPRFDTSPGRWPRPRLHLASGTRPPQRLADRAIAGIRNQSARLRGPAAETGALPGMTPGPLATLWSTRWYSDSGRTELDGGARASSRGRYAVGLR